MATPQRPLPGAFMNTPAPVRPSLSSQRPPSFRLPSNPSLQRQNSLPASNQLSMPAPSGIQPLNGSLKPMGPLDRAEQRVNDFLAADQRFPALDDYILQGISAEYDNSAGQPWTPYEKIKDYDIPDRVLEQLNGASTSIEIGLFAELHHAWAIVDNVFYLWDYTHPNPELSGFDDISSMISLVKLAKPKPGVFRAEVTHVILIASVTEFMILGLTASTSAAGVVSVSLYHTDLKLPMKGIDPGCLAVSAKSGRIFMGCENSDDIYEITYQNEEKWFSSKCGKINHTAKAITDSINPGALIGSFMGTPTNVEHTIQMEVDDSRDLLYVLTSTSKLRIFHIKDHNVLNHLLDKPWNAILSNIAHTASGIQSRLLGPEHKIVAISTIPKQEATRLALVATTITGVRIFFSLTSGSYYFNDTSSAPSSMQVHHVKFPPPSSNTPASPAPYPQSSSLLNYNANSSVDTNSESLNPTKTAIRFSPGLYFNVVRGNNADTIFVTAPESAKIATLRPSVAGSSKFVEVTQWVTLGTAQVQSIGLVTPSFKAGGSPVGFGNEMAVQYDQAPPEIAVITNMGIHVFKKNRLVDIFATILKSCVTEEEFEDKVKKCCRDYTRTETCASALAVACGQASGINVATDSVVIDLARRAFIEHGGSPDVQDVLDNSQSQIDNVRPSPRAQALMLYVSRLVRSAWSLPILTESNAPGVGVTIKSTVSINKLQSISQSLISLQQFLDSNRSAIPGLSGPEEMNKALSVPEQMALQGENRELDAQLKLIRNAIEGIAFLIQLFERPVVEILMALPEDQRQGFKSLTYEYLFTSDKGKLLAKEVVKGIVSRSIADGSNVDTVADTLRRRCGSFCSADDVVIFKAQEHLQRAINAGSETATGRGLLNDSMKLFQKVAGSLSTQYLEAAISQYIKMSFFAGAIQLCLTVAQERDRANRALAWIKDGTPIPDGRKDIYDKRIECYNEIWKVIEAVDSVQISGDSQVARRKEETYVVIDGSDDEVFQTCLYDWYLRRDLSQRLLDLTSPYVVSYLKRKSENEQAVADLLWRYYAHHREYFEAAKVQLQLAKSGFTIDLEARIEYLSRAKANASARTIGYGDSSGKRQAIISDIQDQLDCATVQLDTLRRLEQDDRLKENRRNVLDKLNGEILSLDTLYHEFVVPADYYDIMLIVFYLSDFRNEPEISAAWKNLIQITDVKALGQNNDGQSIVQEKVRGLGKRVQCSEIIFNPHYMFSIQAQPDRFQASREWPVDLVMDVGVPAETVLAVLETLQYQSGEGWSTSKKRTVAALSVYVAHKWLSESVIGGGLPFGGEEGAMAVLELLRTLSNTGILTGRDGDALRDLLTAVERLI